LLVVTANGYAKRTPLNEYPTQGRHGNGVVTLSKKNLEVTGQIIAAHVVKPGDEVALISREGIVLRTQTQQIPPMGRATRGSSVMRVSGNDCVVSVALLASREKKRVRAAPPALDGDDGRGPQANGA